MGLVALGNKPPCLKLMLKLYQASTYLALNANTFFFEHIERIVVKKLSRRVKHCTNFRKNYSDIAIMNTGKLTA